MSKILGIFAYELEAKAENKPDFKIMTFENGDYSDEVLTYADIVTNGRKIARLLQDRGINKGDTFVLVMRNHPEFVYSLYAATALGAIMVPVDPRIKGERLEYLLRDSKSKGIILSSELIDSTEGFLQNLPDIKMIGVVHKEGFECASFGKYLNLNEILVGPEVHPPDQMNRDLDTPVEIIYTSGYHWGSQGDCGQGNPLSIFLYNGPTCVAVQPG